MTETPSYAELAAQISDIGARIERLLSAGKAEREALLDRADYWQGRAVARSPAPSRAELAVIEAALAWHAANGHGSMSDEEDAAEDLTGAIAALLESRQNPRSGS